MVFITLLKLWPINNFKILKLNYPTCQICAENQDQDGQSVGAGDVGCFQGDVKYESACSSTTSMCATEMTVDWTAKARNKI